MVCNQLYGTWRADNRIMLPRVFRLAGIARRSAAMAQPQSFLSAMMPVVLLAAAFAVLPSICQAQSYLITTVAGGGVPSTPATAISVPLGQVISVAAGAHGDVYFIATGYVFQMNAGGILTRVAGTSSVGYSGDGGLATNAQLSVGRYQGGVAVDGSGNAYIADSNNMVIRKVAAATGIITTVAGTGSNGFSGDGGPAKNAELSVPTAVAVDGFGNLYIADSNNYRVRKVAASTGIITTVAGNGSAGNDSGDGGPATSATLSDPAGVAVDGSGNLYITGGAVIRRVAVTTGIITTVAGNGTLGYSGDGGLATNAQIEATNLAVDGSGDIYISDLFSDVIRKVTVATGIITTVAGNGAAGYTGDGGLATSARLNDCQAVAVDGAGNLYIADAGNFVIRKVTAATGIITTVAGNGAAGPQVTGGLATLAQLAAPAAVAVDGTGSLYIADLDNFILKLVPATGILSIVAGSGAPGYTGDGGPATQASFNGAFGIAVDSSGNIYIADTGNNVIRKVTAATGIITTVAGNGHAGYSGDGGTATSAELTSPVGVAVDKSGNIYIADSAALRKVAAVTGIITTVAPYNYITNARVAGIAVDGSGNIYVAYSQNGGFSVIQETTVATGTTTRVAGTFYFWLSGVAVDASGNIYISESDNLTPNNPTGAILKVTAAIGITTTIAGQVAGFSGDGGPATSAELNTPAGVAVDGSGNVYIADLGNRRIRLLIPEGIRPLLSVTKTHVSNFTFGQTGATYSVAVSNAVNAGPVSGPVTVGETIPAGLTLQSMSGAGWTCSANATCTRSDALLGGSAYPAITVAVNVAQVGPSQAINRVTLTAVGATATAAGDTTNIVASASAATVTTVSAASGAAPAAPDSVVSLYAANIDTAVFAATAGPPAPLPTTLGGVSATITDSSGTTTPIGLIVVTPSQVNAVLPAGLQTGEATVNLMSSSGAQITGAVTLVTVAPSLFTADESGGGIAAAQVVIAHKDGGQTFIGAIASCNSGGCTPTPINLGSSTDQAVLELFGTGIRGAGGASNVTVAVGNTQGTVQYAGAQGAGAPSSFYGLDQVNVLLPRSLAGSGTVNVVLTAGGQTANTVTMDIQ
jgi:uncharacterized protein (TIGR03437 family)